MCGQMDCHKLRLFCKNNNPFMPEITVKGEKVLGTNAFMAEKHASKNIFFHLSEL